MYGIRCNVSGGVTGNRTGLLKDRGQVVQFDCEKDATVEAACLTRQMTVGKSEATYSYTVVVIA